jgi:hypothetical protein
MWNVAMTRWSLVALLAFVVMGVVACGEPPKKEECGDTDVSYSKCVQPIFVANCGGAGCHGPSGPSFGLTLTEGGRANLVDKDSQQVTDKKLVAPGDPENSYLYLKINANPPQGNRMPSPSSPLSDANIKLIRTWIAEGAKDN